MGEFTSHARRGARLEGLLKRTRKNYLPGEETIKKNEPKSCGLTPQFGATQKDLEDKVNILSPAINLQATEKRSPK